MEDNHTNKELFKIRLLLVDILTGNANIKDGISDKRAEQVTGTNSINTGILVITKRMGKYIFINFLLGCLLSFILGGIANENKQLVYPLLQKSYNFLSNIKIPLGGS